MKRALTPALNPTGIGAAIAAVYACIVMISNAVSHHGVIDPQVIVAALGAVMFAFARGKVTPVADPRDGNGNPLTAPAATRPPYVANLAAALPGPIPFGDLTASTVAHAPAPPPPPETPSVPSAPAA